ncbi:hypothetical protein HYFRA_00005078 [Hymenoscyphus fraxineus]|uniref:FAD-binding PCMH-type domain-containing protein n=1 Tax=Hymenoscyphus fraxineus TaxID=746836 RepID=A0A9N9L845_9HELO|nr:hypothetical protein HYFRA_00005078 [Hymenoscyphus fraxineus]
MALRNHDQIHDCTTPLITKPEDYGKATRPSGPRRRFEFKALWGTQLYKTTALILCLLFVFAIVGVLLTRNNSLESCLDQAGIPFLAKGSKDWAQEIMPWNLRLAYTPAAVAIPQSIDQIQGAVFCGIKNQVRVSAKGGGHSFGSYGLGGEDGHLVIELSQMYAVTLFENHTAKIQPGARLGHVSTELYNQGQRAIPHGACPGVGLAGHVLYGGYGRASRTHGLTLDWLIGAKVILTDGSMVYCSATENTDLFWALRGAGPSFGIVAEFEFSTFEAPDVVTVFTIDLPWMEESAVETIIALQDLAISAPKELNIFLFVSVNYQVIQGMYFGDGDGLNQALQPLLARLEIKGLHMSTGGWLKALEQYTDGEDLDQTYPYNSHATYYTTSLMTPALTEDQTKKFIATMFANIHQASARHSWDIFFEMHGGNNSAVAQVDPSATAYVHRDKLLLYQLSDTGSHGQFPDEGFAVLRNFTDSVTNSMAPEDWGMYANFLDTQLDGKTAQQLYWGNNLQRLRSIKAKLDPADVFWNPQGISPLS